MTGEQSAVEQNKAAIYQDARVVLCAQVLECWCGISKHEIYTTYELQVSSSVKNLPELMAKPAVTLERFLTEQAFLEEDDADENDDTFEPSGSGVESMGLGDRSLGIHELVK